MKPGSKAGAASESENACRADDFEGRDKSVEFCGARKGLGTKISDQQPFPERPTIIMTIITVVTITVDIIITISIFCIIVVLGCAFFDGWDRNLDSLWHFPSTNYKSRIVTCMMKADSTVTRNSVLLRSQGWG